MKPKVFVVQPIPEVALDILREAADVTVYPYLDRQISVDELAANAKRADWLFVLHETPVTAEVINANPHLKGIGCMAGGHLHIDVEAANARKVPIVLEDKDPRTSVIPATGDLTLAMLLGLAYRLVDADRYTRCGKFRQEQTMALMGLGCRGKTIGLIGMGKLALYMVPRLLAFDMNVVYSKPTRLPIEREQELGVKWASSLDELLKQSDFVCIACRYSPSTHKLIGKRELEPDETRGLSDQYRAWPHRGRAGAHQRPEGEADRGRRPRCLLERAVLERALGAGIPMGPGGALQPRQRHPLSPQRRRNLGCARPQGRGGRARHGRRDEGRAS